jgi:hypothetical protein
VEEIEPHSRQGRLHPGEQGGASFLQGQRGGVLAIVEGLDDDLARKVDHAELMDAPRHDRASRPPAALAARRG